MSFCGSCHHLSDRRLQPPLPHELLLWRQDWGINNLEPWDSDSAVASVARLLTAESARAHRVAVHQLIDLERTRIIRLLRSGWTVRGELHVAALTGSARPTKLQDPEVTRVYAAMERWLKDGADRIELPMVMRYRPRIYARPEAAKWVAAGGQVSPWDG